MVVKITVPFWIPIIIRHLIFRVPKRDHHFDNHVGLRVECFGLKMAPLELPCQARDATPNSMCLGTRPTIIVIVTHTTLNTVEGLGFKLGLG